MTIDDLIAIARDESRDPRNMHLVIRVGDTLFDVTTSDEQSRTRPELVMCAIVARDDNNDRG